ncbi:bifunctional hydroxymethylpyrimidine kinase/phosphomethylpyrimidine kinase [Microbacterium sp. NEAU-LLC]|uniref:Bifunctional hydroxymethylpyrimidine kinase/phosphomethylpyrimidine kinase n=1 Tax=Microbacterium helvum TaxID=2773713 RepID=A0ABR8NQH1_9MICO|nr:bifunctional hydroxymethylpyrimidine kinase/phosphomethylpyrimidine kinase [Microbacterium helvum]MBD3942895.1 bifunctional hydroxymethylpyrimidine kinase/phosphomethylpyrimidine kinase [Microbacterium helvum]
MSGIPRVLSIAGTDPTGGAGIHADLKTIGALGGYGMAVVTALVAQNTRGVREVHVPPVGFLTAQLDAVSDDVEIDAVKIGMLQDAAIIEVVRDWLARVRPPVVVLDPVMVATSGDRLLDAAAEDALRGLCTDADLVTPNLAELAVLTGRPVAATWDEALDAARRLHESTGTLVLLKGGHLDGADCPDALVGPVPLVGPGGVHEVAGARVATRNTHGTGCSLSSAMATLRAGGASWPDALVRAKQWLTGALAHADALHVGRGNGPVDHFHELRAPADRAWSAEVWDAAAAVRAGIEECAFVRGLGDGSLERDVFTWYLAQDARYLGEYARLLARASALAPTADEQAFWARSAQSALVEEQRLHSAHLDGRRPADPAPATTAYTDHLHASGRTYGELVAAVLPCFWIYADLGTRLTAARHETHPYDDWLAAYGDPAFAEATAQAVRIADAAAGAASAHERARMSEAFRRSAEHELRFFEAPMALVPARA